MNFTEEEIKTIIIIGSMGLEMFPEIVVLSIKLDILLKEYESLNPKLLSAI